MHEHGKSQVLTIPTRGDAGQTSLLPLLLRPAEAARLLRICPRKLWSLTADGTIPAIRFGRSVRYLPEDLREAIERLRQPKP